MTPLAYPPSDWWKAYGMPVTCILLAAAMAWTTYSAKVESATLRRVVAACDLARGHLTARVGDLTNEVNALKAQSVQHGAAIVHVRAEVKRIETKR